MEKKIDKILEGMETAGKVAVKKATAKKATEEPKGTLNPHGESKELASAIAKFLDDKKATDIVIIDLAGKTIIADYFVLASARSNTAVKALADYVDEKLSKDFGIEPLRRDGMQEGQWVAVDYNSVILHVFEEGTRELYQLEKLWNGSTPSHIVD